MPSQNKPCGPAPLHAQRYGALPIGHRMRGSTDTTAIRRDFARERSAEHHAEVYRRATDIERNRV